MKFEIHFAPLLGTPRKYCEAQELRASGPRAALRAYDAVRAMVNGDRTRVGCYLAVQEDDEVVDAFDMSDYGPEFVAHFLNNLDPNYRTPPVSVPASANTKDKE